MTQQTAQHTPGPWRTGDLFNTVFGPPNGQPAPETIAKVSRGNRANARLIAAAPALLAALERVVDEGGHDHGRCATNDNCSFDQARAAIKAARGDA